MDDFAGAAMMRLVAAGLRAQGLPLLQGAGASAAKRSASAHVPLASKQAALQAIAAQCGPLALLRIGAAVNTLGDEPTLVALTQARTPAEMMARWQRLERFIHSRHRIQVLASEPARLVFRHVSTAATSAPSLVEDLLIAGLLVALAQRTGGRELRARPPAGRRWLFRNGQWQWPPSARAADTWELAWQPDAEGLEAAQQEAGPREGLLDKARRALRDDPGAPWTVARLAQRFGLPPRSLQRALQAEQTRFTELLANTRLAQASRLLTTTALGPAEIGYLCGYADQAHFTREFKRHTALTPVKFREQLRQASP